MSDKELILQDISTETLDIILAMSPEKKNQYFTEVISSFYPRVDHNSQQFVDLLETYISSFYVEKLFRSNLFFYEKFTPIYTSTGLIRNIVADLYYTDESLITH